MSTEADFYIRKAIIRDSWLVNAGMPGRNQYTEGLINWTNRNRSEWNFEYESLFRDAVQKYVHNAERLNVFIRYQKNRLLQGYFRYGGFKEKKPKWNRISAIERYYSRWEEYGNGEYLVDVANYCMLEWFEGDSRSVPETLEWDGVIEYSTVGTCIAAYRQSKTKEYLMWLAVVVYLEFQDRRHPWYHFYGTSDTDLHCKL